MNILALLPVLAGKVSVFLEYDCQLNLIKMCVVV